MSEIITENHQVNGKRMSLLKSGEGKKHLLLLPGWPVTKESFYPAIPLLVALGFCVIAPDFPGFGESEKLDQVHSYNSLAQAVLGLMDVLEIPKTAVGGVSMGCGVGVWLAADNPDRVDKMFLNSPPARVWNEMSLSQKVLLKAAEKSQKLREGFFHLMKNKPEVFAQLLWRENIDLKDSSIKRILEAGKNTTIEASWEMLLDNVYNGEIIDKLGKVTVSTIVFIGENDRQFLRTARKVTRIIPNAELRIIEGTDHWMAIRDPKRFAQQFEN